MSGVLVCGIQHCAVHQVHSQRLKTVTLPPIGCRIPCITYQNCQLPGAAPFPLLAMTYDLNPPYPNHFVQVKNR